MFKHKNVFTLQVSFIGSYTEDEPDFPPWNNLILQKTVVWHRQFKVVNFKDLGIKASFTFSGSYVFGEVLIRV